MKTKVINCGNYNCVHCTGDGTCSLLVISITPDGKCGVYKPSNSKVKSMPVHSEQDEHTNMC